MSTSDINAELKNTRFFLGTFPCDKWPLVTSLPATVVFNTDPASECGEHWVSVHVRADHVVEYFDSFGFPPLIQETQQFIAKNAKRGLLYNTQTLQSPYDVTCGQFAISFIRHVAAGGKLQSFLASYKKGLRSAAVPQS